tara:strand:- start:401 stop:898 length:498 start_codon:yes stop_codon:yes gene_type:complete
MIIFILLSLIPLISARELIAEVRDIPAKCGLDETVQYWINTASAARESTLQIIGGDFKLSNLEVSGDATFGETNLGTLNFDHLIENEHEGDGTPLLSKFKKQVQFDGGISLVCPQGLCTMRAHVDGGNTDLRLENMDLVIGTTSVGATISDMLDRIQTLEQMLDI